MVDMAIAANQARLNVTWAGQNGDYPDPVSYDANDGDVRQFASEGIRTGYIPGIAGDATVDLKDFVVERFNATQEVPYNRIVVRPKTPFG